ncbi:phage terminase large subunit [Microvirga mediterraneensis]|uniref:Terminase n=1 Tax=Microvirga mediterraneensis TaxID=2754695 RepID=A0A838BPU3_9HYPH|nr:phage terminase large subunit [Microvirga mediterraneensis]MBA1156922.1 terminase [Microvirga mediterraneensis]
MVDCPLPEIFFGGARGGGKTDGVLGKWALKEKRYGAAFNAVMFRKTTVSSEDAIERSREIFGPLGGKFNEAKLRWRMPNGGRVSFAYLDSVKDAQEYQGRNLTDAWVEEAGQYDSPDAIDRLFGVLRSAQGVPVQLILTANPGGPGQHWIRERYKLNPFPRGPKLVTRLLSNGNVHKMAVIPSRITDNKVMLASDPQYIDRLHLVGSAQLVKAWLDGDWTAIEGAFFGEWSEQRHVIEPFRIPDDWLRFRSMDWGSASPFSVGWWAVVGDDHRIPGLQGTLPRGALVRYREWYGASGPNKGLKLTAEEVGAGIKSREGGEKITYGVLDPAAFAEDGGPSIASRLMTKSVVFRPADNKRVASRGAMGGWDIMRQRLKGQDGVPMIYCFSTCEASIRTIPVLQHDQSRPEDLDTNTEDHAADEWRYACMSRPWVPVTAQPKKPDSGYRSTGSKVSRSWR